jgi:hypothetical protein
MCSRNPKIRFAMRSLWLFLIIFPLISSIAHGGLFKESVEFADLSQLSADGLQSLKDTEFEVFMAEVRLAASKVTRDLAQDDLKQAESVLDKERLDLKAAKAEYEAAEAKQEKDRMASAERTMQKAKEAIKKVELLVKWKGGEVKARKAAVERAKLSVELAEAKRDLARVSRLVEEKVPSASKYSLADWENKVKKTDEKYQKAMDKEKREALEAEQLKAQYEKAAEGKVSL